MAQCKAANKRGARCRLEVVPGSDFCETAGHDEYMEGLERTEGAPEPTGAGEAKAGEPEPTAAAEAPPSPPAPSEPKAPERRDVLTDAWAGFEDLPRAAGPELDPAASPTLAAPPPSEGDGELPAYDDLEELIGSVPAASSSGNWTPDEVGPLVAVPHNLVLRKFGKELRPADVQTLGKGWTKFFNHVLGRIDPNNPYGAAALSSAVVIGHHLLPDAVFGNGKAEAKAEPQRAEPETEPQAARAANGGRAFNWSRE